MFRAEGSVRRGKSRGGRRRRCSGRRLLFSVSAPADQIIVQSPCQRPDPTSADRVISLSDWELRNSLVEALARLFVFLSARRMERNAMSFLVLLRLLSFDAHHYQALNSPGCPAHASRSRRHVAVPRFSFHPADSLQSRVELSVRAGGRLSPNGPPGRKNKGNR